MTLRMKTLLAVGLTFAALTAILYVISQSLLKKDYSELEERHSRREVQRALAVMAEDLAALGATAADWAGWDDTCRFVEDANDEYARANLTDETLATLRLNLLMFVHSSGRLVFGRTTRAPASRAEPIPESFLEHFSDSAALFARMGTESKVDGLLGLPDGPMMIAARPILTSQKQGPVRGTLIMGRWLDTAEMQRLGRITGLSLSLHPVRPDSPYPAVADASANRPAGDESVVVQPDGVDTIAGYTVLNDVFGKPVVILKADMARLVYRQGVATMHYFLGWIVLATLAVTLVVLLLLDKLVLSRLGHLNSCVQGIGKDGGQYTPIEMAGRDELADLAGAIDRMVESLNHSQAELRKANEKLERRVEDRTAELAEANDALRAEIRERKLAEQALRASEERLKAIFDSVQAGIVVVDAQLHTIIDVNPAAAQMIGALSERLIGRKCHEFICPAEEGKCPITALGQQVDHSERIVLKADGTRIPVLKTVVPVAMQDRTVLLESFLDLTAFKESEEERARLEAQLRHAMKMEAIGTLAGGIAHDFNNIMTVIIGFTELAMFKTPKEAKTRRHLAEIHNAANRAKDVVKQILAFSRRDNGEPKPVQVSVIVQETIRLLQASLPSNIEIRQHIEVKDQGADTILADPTQIQQVLMNLCTNAAHAMHETGGVLTIGLSPTSFEHKDSTKPTDLAADSCLRLIVSDTGHGMDEATMQRIFEPYYTTKGPGEGTGLGLAVVHGIVKRHGGTINVSSKPQGGTTFTLFLPISGPAPEETAKGGLSAPPP